MKWCALGIGWELLGGSDEHEKRMVDFWVILKLHGVTVFYEEFPGTDC